MKHFIPPSFISQTRRGFSIVELMTVVAVLSVLTAVVVPGVSGILQGQALRGASDRAWTAVTAARAEAISRQTNVALVITAGRSADPNQSEAIMLLAASRDGSAGAGGWTWEPASRWQKLPVGVEARPLETGSFLQSSAATPSIAAYGALADALPAIDGAPVDRFSYVVFRPDGSVDSGSANPVLAFRRLVVETGPEMALVLSPDSGRARIVNF